jgi:hypothetical protein
LRKALKPGQTIYFVVTHVSKSGMQRSIEFYIPTHETYTDYVHHGSATNHPMSTTSVKRKRLAIERITWDMARVLGYRIDQKNGGLIVGGCGMDMGFHCVYTLGLHLWPKGTAKPHRMRNGQPDTDGGYALNSRQM